MNTLTPFANEARVHLLPRTLGLGRGLLVLFLAFSSFLNARDLDDEVNGRIFSVVAFSYKPMPERFDLQMKHCRGPAYDQTTLVSDPGKEFSYTTSDGHHRIFVMRFHPAGMFLVVQSLQPNLHDMAVLVVSPDALDSTRLKACLEMVPACACSGVVSEGYPVDARGAPDVTIIYRDFGREPVIGGKWTETSPKEPK